MRAPKPPVLFFPFGLLSHYLRCLQLAEALRDDYDIYFRDCPEYAHFVLERGFRLVAVDELSAPEVMAGTKAFDFGWLNTPALERVFLSQAALLRRMRPAFVVGDMSHTLKMAAASTGTPYVSILNGYMSEHYALTRPLPRQHPLMESGLPIALLELFAPLGESVMMWHIHRPFRELRRKYGLPLLHTYRHELSGDLTCLADSPDIFPQKELPADHCIIGPLYHVGREDEAQLLGKLDPAKPTIVVNMGSTGALERLLCLTDNTFSDYNFIIGGDRWGAFRAVHLHSAPFVNVPAVLPRADLVICHGGNGAIHQALAAGLPVLCLTEFFEQEWNAKRIGELGLSEMIPSEASPSALKSLLEKWLDEKGAARFRNLAPTLQVADSVARFRQAVAEWVNPSRPGSAARPASHDYAPPSANVHAPHTPGDESAPATPGANARRGAPGGA